MPRINGVMQALPNTYGVPGRPIESAKYNSQLDDLIADANAPRPITAGGTGAVDAVDARSKLGVTAAIETLKNATVSRTGDTGMSGRFVTSGTFEGTLVHNAGYFDIQSFSTGTYGTGLARFWYNPNTRTITAGPQGDGSGRLSLTGIDIDVSQALGAVPDTRSIAAGNGLTGGGSFAANRTLTMGTPSTLSATSTNATSSTSHTHNIDAASVAAAGNAALAVGTVGTVAFLRHTANTPFGPGVDVSGASLRYANAAGGFVGSPTPAGTWRALGSSGGTDAASSTTLFLRIA